MFIPRPVPRAATAGGSRSPGAAGAALAGGVVVLCVVHVLLRDTLWDPSEGVYGLSAHLLLHGGGLYGSFAAAQPPGIFLVGALVLGIRDSLESLRLGVAILQLAAGLIAARTVFDLTRSRTAAILTPGAVLLTPWAVREHGALLPELVALPLLLGAARLVADQRHARVAGVLLGLLPLIKYPLAIPAVALLAVAADRRRTVLPALCVVAAGLALTTLFAGPSFWRDTVLAQTQTGTRAPGPVLGYWVQAGWNLVGILVPAALGLVAGRGLLRSELLRAHAALLLGLALTLLGNFKQGTSLDILVPLEAAVVPLAVCGTVLAGRFHRRLWLFACLAGVLFTLAQSVSLLAAPHHPSPFLRPGSRPAWGVILTGEEFRRAVRTARRCPPGRPYSGAPQVALSAGREMPGGQPDQFLVGHAATLAGVRRRIDAAGPLCP
jgi:hypothetical protein